MTNANEVYVDLEGQEWNLTSLDEGERALWDDLCRRAHPGADWFAFDNHRFKALAALYEPRGLSRRQITHMPLFRLAQDLSGRLAIAAGQARLGDYRDQLQLLISTRFKNRREFCEATALSEDMLSHVLAGRKDFSLETLTRALDKIGCKLRIVPVESVVR